MTSTAVIEYYGLSSFAIEYGQTRLLVDPWLFDPEWSDLELAEFEDVDHIFVTHGAYDHLADASPIASTSGATVYTEPAVADHLVDEGLPSDQVERRIWGNAFEIDNIGVRVLETRHLSYFESSGQRVSGIPLGFHFEFPDASLYYVGDTSLFSDLELFVRRNDPDVVILPVGSAPGDLAPLPPRDAAIAASWFDVDSVIPVHYVPGSDEVEIFQRELDAQTNGDSPAVDMLEVGDRYEL